MKTAARTATKIFLVFSIVGYIGAILCAFIFKAQILDNLPEALKGYADYVIYVQIGAAAYGLIMALFSFLSLGLGRRGLMLTTAIFSLLINPTVAILLFCIAHYEVDFYEPIE